MAREVNPKGRLLVALPRLFPSFCPSGYESDDLFALVYAVLPALNSNQEF